MENKTVNFIELLRTFFEKEGYFICAEPDDEETSCMFRFTVAADSVPDIHWNLWVTDTGFANLRTYPAFGIRDEARVVKTLNELNCQQRFLKFFLDDDRDLVVEYNFYFCGSEENITETAEETLFLVNEIMDDSYPQLMKAVWSAAEITDPGVCDFKEFLDQAFRQMNEEVPDDTFDC